MKSLRALFPYLARYRRSIIPGMFFILCSVLLATFVPYFIREAIDSLTTEMSTATMLRYALLVTGVSAASGVFLYLQRQTIIVASRRIENDLRNDFFRHVQTLPLRYFQNTPTGDIMAHSTNDIGAVRMFVGPAIMYSTETLFTFVIVLTLMLRINPVLTLLTLVPLPLVSYAVHRLGHAIHKRYEDIQSHFSDMTTRAQENISGMRVVQSYRREDAEIARFERLSTEYLVRNMRMARVQSFFMPLLSILIGLSVIVTVWLGGLRVISGELSLGELMQFIMYVSMLIWPMIAVGWVASIVQRAAASMKRLNRIFAETSDVGDSERTDHSITSLEGRIELRGVQFRYRDDLPSVLEDVSVEVAPGRTLAIIGHTGSGKTSLVNLIPRLYDVTGGTLLIDGHDVRTIPVAVLRRSIAYVTQETFLFSDTLAANIAYGVDAADEAAVLRAAEIARIDKDVVDFPLGYETMLGERGITLSGGQKQRVSIARAVLRDPEILILDDALSAVDTHTEEEILGRLRGVMAGRTSILISHRISTVRDADHIIVLDRGRIAEAGTHDELVARGGIYADIHTRQLLAQELEEIE